MAGAGRAQLQERDAELKEMDGVIADVCSGRGRLLAVEGPAGIGKTSLLGSASDRCADAGMRVLSARGSELEREFAFGVVRQLLEPVLYAAGAEARARWFAGAAAFAQPLLDESLEATTEEEVRFRRRHGLYWLLANLAREAPVAVVVDDAQWADEPSVGFLRHLATRLAHVPVLLVVGSRSDNSGVAGLLADPSARVLRPAPLSLDAVSARVSDAFGRPVDSAFAAACQRATAGNPFLIGELLREVNAEGLQPDAAGVERLRDLSPRAVTVSVLVRLADMPPSAAALARAAAVLGEADLPTTAALAGLELAAAVEAAAALTRGAVLEPAERLRFIHPLVRTVLYEDIAPAERSLAHAAAARLLSTAGAAADHVAAQLMLADPVREPWALAALRAAARRATLRGAPEVAADFLERALPEAGDASLRFELMLALGRAELLAGRAGAVERLRAAVELAQTPAEHARAVVKLARVLRYQGAGGEAVELLEAAADQDARIEHELLAARTVSYEARRRLAGRADAWFKAARRPPESAFDRFVFAAEAVEAAGRGRPVADVAGLTDAALAECVNADHLGLHALLLCTYAHLLIDRFDDADALLGVIAQAASARGAAHVLAVVAAQRALVASRRGRLDVAAPLAIDALELAAEFDHPPAYLLTAAAALLWVAVEQGTDPHPLAAAVHDDGDSLFGRHLNHARAHLHLAQGRTAQGVTDLLAVGEREAAIGWTGPAQFAWRSEAALALASLGENERARELAAEELERARVLGAPRAIGVALRAGALLDGGDLGRLEEAAAILDGCGAELERARVMVDLGAALRRARKPAHARGPLRAGFELATRCAATRLAEHARQELLAAGGRPRRAALSGRDALTPSELRVVELAAGELMNRDIAQTLFVTEKTVETHLRHAYAKLGLKSRRELAEALASSR